MAEITTPEKKTPRLLHSMIRVQDLDRSLDFYTGLLGMKLFRRKEFPDEKVTLAFVGYGTEESAAALQLRFEQSAADRTPNAPGRGVIGHIAIAVDDVRGFCARMESEGAGRILKPPYQLRPGGSIIAFVKDPDGCEIELIQKQ